MSGFQPLSSQEVHVKMCKKIAQLTKVIFALNTKNEENESLNRRVKEDLTREQLLFVAATNDKITKLETELKLLVTRDAEYADSFQLVKAQLKSVQEAADIQKRTLTQTFNSEVALLKERLTGLTATLENLKDIANRKIESLQVALNQLKSDKTAIETDHHAFRVEADQSILTLKDSLASLQADKSRLQAEQIHGTTKLTAALADVKQLTAQLNTAAQEISTLNSQLTAIHTQTAEDDRLFAFERQQLLEAAQTANSRTAELNQLVLHFGDERTLLQSQLKHAQAEIENLHRNANVTNTSLEDQLRLQTQGALALQAQLEDAHTRAVELVAARQADADRLQHLLREQQQEKLVERQLREQQDLVHQQLVQQLEQQQLNHHHQLAEQLAQQQQLVAQLTQQQQLAEQLLVEKQAAAQIAAQQLTDQQLAAAAQATAAEQAHAAALEATRSALLAKTVSLTAKFEQEIADLKKLVAHDIVSSVASAEENSRELLAATVARLQEEAARQLQTTVETHKVQMAATCDKLAEANARVGQLQTALEGERLTHLEAVRKVEASEERVRREAADAAIAAVEASAAARAAAAEQLEAAQLAAAAEVAASAAASAAAAAAAAAERDKRELELETAHVAKVAQLVSAHSHVEAELALARQAAAQSSEELQLSVRQLTEDIAQVKTETEERLRTEMRKLNELHATEIAELSRDFEAMVAAVAADQARRTETQTAAHAAEKTGWIERLEQEGQRRQSAEREVASVSAAYEERLAIEQTNLLREKEAMQSEMADVRNVLLAREKELVSVQSAIGNLEQDISDLRERHVEKMTALVDQQDHAISDLRRTHEDAQGRLRAELTDKLTDLKADFAAERFGFTNQVATLKEKLCWLQNFVDTRPSKPDDVAEIETLKKLNADKAAALERLADQLGLLRQSQPPQPPVPAAGAGAGWNHKMHVGVVNPLTAGRKPPR